MTAPEVMPGSQEYSAVVLTFRRPDTLRTVVESVRSQDHPPTTITVVDNDPLRSAEQIVATLADGPIPVRYLPAGSNLGPAGGWACGVEALRSSSDRGEWVAIFDDDDPLDESTTMGNLIRHADRCPASVAAVGLRGARLRPFALLSRVRSSSERVDYLASSGAPMYRWSAIDEVGFFDPDLFFGFEDLDLGLRLRSEGWTISVALAAQAGPVRDTASDRTAWREYYKTRSLVIVCRRHLGGGATAATVARAGLAALPWLLWAGGAPLVAARWRGIRDGLLNRLGPGSYVPSSNPSKIG